MDYSPIRLAILDSDKLMMDAVEFGLRSLSNRIQPVVTATAWRELFVDGEFGIDVVVLDLDHAGESPTPLKIESLIARGAKVLATSLRPEPELIRVALDAGAHGYVCKAEGFDALADGIRAVTDKGSYLSEMMEFVMASAEPAPYPKLTKQEVRVLALYGNGEPIKAVASKLEIAHETARTYVKQIRAKLASAGFDVSDKVALHQFAVKYRLLEA